LPFSLHLQFNISQKPQQLAAGQNPGKKTPENITCYPHSNTGSILSTKRQKLINRLTIEHDRSVL